MGNPGPAGIGGVIRDYKGQVLFVFSKCIGIADSNLAEFMAVINALFYVVNANFDLLPDIILENDSKAVISWVNNVLDSPWKYNNLFNKLQNLCLGLGKISFVHIFREANHFADFVAKTGVHRTSDLVAWL